MYYKPSKKVSPLGFVFTLLFTLVAAAVLSIAYIFAKELGPFVFVGIPLAIFAGLGIGGACMFAVKIFKLHYPLYAVLAVCFALVLSLPFKWAMFAANDVAAHMSEVAVTAESSFEQLGFGIDFKETDIKNANSAATAQSPARERTANSKIAKAVKEMNDKKAEAYIREKDLAAVLNLSPEQMEESKKQTYYAFRGYDNIIGKNNKTVIENLKFSLDNDILSYREQTIANKTASAPQWEKVAKSLYGDRATFVKAEDYSFTTLLFDPAKTITAAKEIAKEGRYAITGVRSNTDPSMTLTGEIVYGVWVLEFFCFLIPAAAVAAIQARRPFINKHNRWATLDRPILAFAPVDEILEEKLHRDPMAFLETTPFRLDKIERSYDGLNVWHAEDYSEIYVDLTRHIFNMKTHKYNQQVRFRYLPLEKQDIYRVYRHCGVQCPFGDAEFRKVDTHVYGNDGRVVVDSPDPREMAQQMGVPEFMDVSRMGKTSPVIGRGKK